MRQPCVVRPRLGSGLAGPFRARSTVCGRPSGIPIRMFRSCFDPVEILFRFCLDLGHHPPAARLFALHPCLLLELFVARLQLEVGVLERFEAAEEREHLVINGALEVIPLSDFALESLQSIL